MADDPVLLMNADWARPLPALTDLEQHLLEAGFPTTARLPFPGGAADVLLDPANVRAFAGNDQNRFHRSAMAGLYRRAMAVRHPRAVALHELLTLGRPMPRARVRDLIPAELVDRLLDVDVFESHGATLRSNVLVTTWAGRLFVSDPTRFQHHAEYAYSGRSSFSPVELLAALGWRAPAGDPSSPRRLLDLGCGSGLGAVAAAAAGVEHVLGTDVVERCLRFARLNAALNDASNTEFRYSDVFANIDGEFDLVISNTPCVWDELQQATFATGGGSFGNDLPMRMIGEALDHLRPQGLLVAVVAAPIVRGQPYIAEVIERTCGDRGVNVRVEPLIAEFEFEHAATYRSHGISAFVRYVVTISPAARFSMSFAPGDRFRFGCYRARAASVRLVAAVTRFAAPPATTPLG